jgi:hypothetical protein
MKKVKSETFTPIPSIQSETKHNGDRITLTGYHRTKSKWENDKFDFSKT